MPVRGILGTDYLRVQPHFQVIKCPFSGHDIVAVEAITPDFTVVHGFKADKRGNVLVERNSDVDFAVKAARTAIVTVEEVVDELVPDRRSRLMSWIDFHYIIHAPLGAHPVGCPGYYDLDGAHLKKYVEMASTDELFHAYLEDYVYRPSGHEEYLNRVVKEGWNPYKSPWGGR